ncbi:MAG: acyl-CoA synthetase, partial [Mycobacteriaceae bacterium]
ARALPTRGIGERARVGVLCRNHRVVLQVLGATGRLGGDVVLLNTGLSERQFDEVLIEQHMDVLVADGEFADENIANAPEGSLPTWPRRSRTVVLTFGTTGTPKGAQRPEPRSWVPAAAVLSRIPLRAGETTVVAAPTFHTWGFAASSPRPTASRTSRSRKPAPCSWFR